MKEIKFNPTTKQSFDGARINKIIMDEAAMWDTSTYKVFKIWKLFYLCRGKHSGWFRILGGYGIRYKNTERCFIIFSERNKCQPQLRIGKWLFRILKPIKINSRKQ